MKRETKKAYKRMGAVLLAMVLLLGAMPACPVFAREGDSGYDGGISSGEAPGKTTYDYQEVCFLTGEPIVFKGTLMIKKSQKNGVLTATYTYSLKNSDMAATLSRVLSLTTKLTNQGNGQTVEETSYSKPAIETVKIGTTTYTLKSATSDFTRSSLIDSKPAINYYAGNLWSRKVYQTSAAAKGKTVTIEATGDFYGYDQYWGQTEVQTQNYTISCEDSGKSPADKWGGTATVRLSSTVTNQLKYYKNQPDQISFDGSYVLSQNNSSILEYDSSLPEFDANGVSTDNMVSKSDSLELDTFPVQKRLPSVDLSSIRGHWAENDIKLMYSLGVFQGSGQGLKPDLYMSKAEFASAMVQVAREVPPDPALASRLTVSASSASKAKQQVVSPFDDVSVDNKYFTQINSAFTRGLLIGKGNNLFGPNDSITVADAVTVFIRALGLESMAPSPQAVTNFRDNDQIPAYARNATYVGQKIGLVQGDSKGNLHPNDKLTKAQAATMLKRFITYMQDGIRKDYSEKMVNY